jgi:ABC-type molybdate transport system substrate-binding protein
VTTEYLIGVTTASRHPEAARAWIDFVLSERGRAVLDAAGFRR